MWRVMMDYRCLLFFIVCCLLAHGGSSVDVSSDADDPETSEGNNKKMEERRDKCNRNGDLILTDEQYKFLFPNKTRTGRCANEPDHVNRTKRAGSLKSVYLWDNGVVPYHIELHDFNQVELNELKGAMAVYEEHTCIKFVPAQRTDKNFLWIHHTLDGCFSYLGNLHKGRQEVSLQNPGCRHYGTYLHELGHALGMIHEHQRPDRNAFVHYFPHNVDPENVDQLDLYNIQATQIYNNIPYDLGSIMHYETDTFSVDDVTPTLGVDNPWLARFIGRRYSNRLSYGDVKHLNLAYNCARSCQTRCPNGYVNEKCECITQEMFMEETCQNDPTLVQWCYDLVFTGSCDLTNIEHHLYCGRACDFCPRFSLGQRAIMPKPPTTQQMAANCADQYIYPGLCKKWAGDGKCGFVWMKRFCRKSCNMCNSDVGECPNMYDDRLCDDYAGKGLCLKRDDDGDFVRAKCKDSCNICFKPVVGDCRNRIPEHTCNNMYYQRKCDFLPLSMFQSCPATCDRCDFNAGECQNVEKDDLCSQQAMKNHCVAGPNKVMMRQKCAKACNSCFEGQGSGRKGGRGFFSNLFNL